MLSVKVVRTWLALATVSALMACTTPAVKPETSTTAASFHALHLKQLEKINSFTLQGRIGIQTNPKGFPAASSGSMPATRMKSRFTPP